jgi:cytochrome P450
MDGEALLQGIDDLPLFEPPSGGGPHLYEYFRELRARTPLARDPAGLLIALRAGMIEPLVGEATRQIETEAHELQGIVDGPIFDFMAQLLVAANGETHRRRRQPIARSFAFKLMEAMRPKSAAIAGDLVMERLGAGPIDFLSDVAEQIPARIIADILGIPRSDLPVFMQWIADAGESLGRIEPARRARIEASLVEFHAYVAALLEDRRRRPRADFLSDYVAATAASDELTEGEIRAQIVGLILAGSDTTRNSICMILSALLQHPDQWSALRAEPDKLKRKAVEEGLRFEPVVSGVGRIDTHDIGLEGHLLPAGAAVVLSIVSVLRDPAVYAEPDRFDIHRNDHPRWSFAFGAGAHRCVGEALARVEMEETLTTIARLAPRTELIADPPVLLPGPIRSVSRMQVAFSA